MGKPGPKPVQINWDEFDKLCSYDCTQIEIAAFFDISVDTLENACRRDLGMELSDIWDKRKLLGRVKLRKAQMAIVERGGPGAATMAIFLGKMLLGQKDVPPNPVLSGPVIPTASKPKPKNFTEFCIAAGYPPPYEKQIEMRDFGIAVGDPRLILGSRGYGKTDYVTILGVAYEVYCDWFWHVQNGSPLSETNLIISKSKVRNTAMIEEIANALKANEVPLDKENAHCVRVKGLVGKDDSVEVLTIKSSFRGRHPKRVLMDDPVTEEDTSKAMRELVKKKYDEAYKLCKNIVIIGQPAHALDLYGELRPVLNKLEVPHGTIPELDADLVAMAIAGVDIKSISMSYHLVVPNDGQMPFATLKFMDQPFGKENSVAFLDPSHEGGDHTALSIIRGYMQGVAVVGFTWKRAWNHCLDDIVPLLKKYGVKKLCIETNGLGDMPVIMGGELLHPHVEVVGRRSNNNKHSRIMAAGGYAHLIHLSKECGKSYTDQVTKYEYKAEPDDAPDSLATCLEWMGLLRGKT